MARKESQIILFHIPGSRSERVICLLEELSLSYQLVQPNFTTKNGFPDFKARIGGLGRVPTIQDTIVNEKNECECITISESSAIVE